MYWFERGAALGDPYAAYRLGGAYEKGQGVAADTKTAQHYYRRAFFRFRERAVAGSAYAQYFLGKIYFHGHGVDLNRAEAQAWMARARAQGDESAAAFLKRHFPKE